MSLDASRGLDTELDEMHAVIGEPPITTAEQFHGQIASSLSFPHYYGKNLDALRDVLQGDVECPCELTWMNSEVSREAHEKLVVVDAASGNVASWDMTAESVREENAPDG